MKDLSLANIMHDARRISWIIESRKSQGVRHDTELRPIESQAERSYLEAIRRHRCHPELSCIVTQHPVTVNGKRYRLDFAIPEDLIAIEVDGFRYHRDQESIIKDRRRQRDLERVGWRVIRFAAKEVLTDPDRCAKETVDLIWRYTRLTRYPGLSLG